MGLTERYIAAQRVADTGKANPLDETVVNLGIQVRLSSADLVKEQRKDAEFQSMRQAQHERAAKWSPEVATLKAAQDIASYQAESSQVERSFMRNDMALYAYANPHYKAVFERIKPEASKAHAEAGHSASASASTTTLAVKVQTLKAISALER